MSWAFGESRAQGIDKLVLLYVAEIGEVPGAAQVATWAGISFDAADRALANLYWSGELGWVVDWHQRAAPSLATVSPVCRRMAVIAERDGWECRYCGVPLAPAAALFEVQPGTEHPTTDHAHLMPELLALAGARR